MSSQQPGNASSVSSIRLEILSPEGVILRETAREVIVPSSTGQIGVLPYHAPLFTRLSGGEVVIRTAAGETFITISGGFLEVIGNTVTILADFAIRSEAIEVAKAEEARRRAEEALRNKAEAKVAERDLRKSLIELAIAEKIKKRHRK